MTNFIGFGKIARFNRRIVVTEKIDGTNGQIYIGEDGEFLVGSRNGWITPENDNYGFARWAYANKEELLKLGTGSHFGEWWGQGIQRGYCMKEKCFSLFNVHRWDEDSVRPACCRVVPTLFEGNFEDFEIKEFMTVFKRIGSYASPGYNKPEGIIIYHTDSKTLFKKTFEKDEGKFKA